MARRSMDCGSKDVIVSMLSSVIRVAQSHKFRSTRNEDDTSNPSGYQKEVRRTAGFQMSSLTSKSVHAPTASR